MLHATVRGLGGFEVKHERRPRPEVYGKDAGIGLEVELVDGLEAVAAYHRGNVLEDLALLDDHHLHIQESRDRAGGRVEGASFGPWI